MSILRTAVFHNWPFMIGVIWVFENPESTTTTASAGGGKGGGFWGEYSVLTSFQGINVGPIGYGCQELLETGISQNTNLYSGNRLRIRTLRIPSDRSSSVVLKERSELQLTVGLYFSDHTKTLTHQSGVCHTMAPTKGAGMIP